MSERMTGAERDRRAEAAHGGLVSRSGNIVTLGDGAQWWLNGAQWARNEADAAIFHEVSRLTSRTRMLS